MPFAGVPPDRMPEFFSLRRSPRLRMIDGMPSDQAEQIVAARGVPAIRVGATSFHPPRHGAGAGDRRAAGQGGGFKSLLADRRAALWHALAQEKKALPLFDHLPAEPDSRPAGLPGLSPPEEVLADYRSTGLSLIAHPLSFLHKGLQRRGVVAAEELKIIPNGRPVRWQALCWYGGAPARPRELLF